MYKGFPPFLSPDVFRKYRYLSDIMTTLIYTIETAQTVFKRFSNRALSNLHLSNRYFKLKQFETVEILTVP